MSESKTQLTNPTDEGNKQQEAENKSSHRVTRAIVGGVLGAAAGFLLNPNRAGEHKETMKGKAEKAGGQLKDLKNQTKEKTNEVVGRVKDKVRNSSAEEGEEKETPSLDGADLSQKQLESPGDEAAATEEFDQGEDEEMVNEGHEEGDHVETEEEESANDIEQENDHLNHEEDDHAKVKTGKTTLTVNDDTTK
ncbi:YtxH domain-containing protein [Halobacillus sp. Nhm2S1]|uniref:YtxH domain-containing protein n=1 Tax=Halobacillus sp. Nhm2S1 TaxID=2866716 RepID=UPI001C730268|nr:YtxH domain-containing protein [Halobacillus sp. Nhm2S1]MBX0357570.1 YtxH domain-containing protein [Halobacillus sp. Nhm2S1]